ncbi:FMN-linked oxidoreductase [Corynespora cassiicola Philippines]|uniref:FMN-linked oxidoreductase n=1 Tax=Corynespora cassiicola Philippines TaxID=1448308 RepID=A0A2T2N2K2_CORCC|nr:FMN-linked oxidoreductase [Corynespora cassiicola Philippines]
MSGMKVTALLQPITMGKSLHLRNRITMASMTRNRCNDNYKPTEATVKYYASRAKDGTGLIITEGILVYLHGTEYLHAPMLYDNDHTVAWKKVTDAVHHEGGTIFFQTWHAGRNQNENAPLLKAAGYPVLAPSSIKATGGSYRFLKGNPGHTANITEIQNPREILEQYRHSVSLAKEAGFDGVEILAQGGFLPHNFLLSSANQRNDQYGGSVENRCRFVLELVDTIIEVWGAERVGIKFSPSDVFAGMAVPYKEVSETYTYLIKRLVERQIGYICLSRRGCDPVDPQAKERPAGTELPPVYEPLHEFGPMIKYPGSRTLLMVNFSYSVEEAESLVREDKIDLVALGRPFIYNPDLITRVKDGIPLAENDRGGHIYYGPYDDVNEGYNDWTFASTGQHV